MDSPPPKGSKRQHMREAARQSISRFKQFLSPPSSPSSPRPESTALPAGARSPSALSNTRDRSTAQLDLHDDQPGDDPVPSTDVPIPGADEALSARRTTTGPTPEPTTMDKIKKAGSVAWHGLETALRVLETSADAFPPLKTAVGGFLSCLDIIEAAAKNRDDYDELTTELTTMADTINQYAAELGAEDAGGSAARILL